VLATPVTVVEWQFVPDDPSCWSPERGKFSIQVSRFIGKLAEPSQYTDSGPIVGDIQQFVAISSIACSQESRVIVRP